MARQFNFKMNTDPSKTNYLITTENGDAVKEIDWEYEFSRAFTPRLRAALKHQPTVNPQSLLDDWIEMQEKKDVNGFKRLLSNIIVVCGYDMPDELIHVFDHGSEFNILCLMEEMIIELDDILGYEQVQ